MEVFNLEKRQTKILQLKLRKYIQQSSQHQNVWLAIFKVEANFISIVAVVCPRPTIQVEGTWVGA